MIRPNVAVHLRNYGRTGLVADELGDLRVRQPASPRLFIKAASGRNRINVLGAVNAITKEVLTLSNTTYISADTIVAFFIKLKEHYGDLPLKIVLDNARYQHCEFVENAANKLNITLLFLPPYSPNLNIIERLWKFTKKTILYAKYYETPSNLNYSQTQISTKI